MLVLYIMLSLTILINSFSSLNSNRTNNFRSKTTFHTHNMIKPCSLLLQSNQVKSSYHMELEGLKRGLDKLKGHGIDITELVTDRHCQIQKWMRDNHPDTIHSFDVWHLAKGRHHFCYTLYFIVLVLRHTFYKMFAVIWPTHGNLYNTIFCDNLRQKREWELCKDTLYWYIRFCKKNPTYQPTPKYLGWSTPNKHFVNFTHQPKVLFFNS